MRTPVTFGAIVEYIAEGADFALAHKKQDCEGLFFNWTEWTMLDFNLKAQEKKKSQMRQTSKDPRV